MRIGRLRGGLELSVPLAGANCHVVTPNYEFSSSVGFRPLKVPVTTLDSYLEETMPNERVVLIKIDVEGFEPNVLAGARRVIQRHRPLIWMEFNSVTLNIAQGYSPMAFATALFACFEVLRLDDDGTLIPVPGAGALVHDNITAHRQHRRRRPACATRPHHTRRRVDDDRSFDSRGSSAPAYTISHAGVTFPNAVMHRCAHAG